MAEETRPCLRTIVGLCFLTLAACSDSGGGAPSGPSTPPSSPAPPPPPSDLNGAFVSEASTAFFLSQSTFGATPSELTQLTGTSASQWFVSELNKPASLNLQYVIDVVAADTGNSYDANNSPGMSFWRNAVSGDDQLRQRMAFALSQILVVSSSNDALFSLPTSLAYYQDILTRNAFGNYRDLLEEVTYAPAMGYYLTYLQNQKGDPATGRVPDENYAREIMQLFTIGLVELNSNGEPVLDSGNNPIETYTNDDITGLARVFTGLSLSGPDFWYRFDTLDPDALFTPMEAFPAFHSDLEKSFLGTTIPAGTDATTSIDMALDALFNHPNVAPFISRQLIQRFVTSAPDPAYVGRVAAAFEAGSYQLPDGTTVGDGRRGDLSATLAAILFDDAARTDASRNADTYGKVSEPILRFVQWARAFNVSTVTPEYTIPLWDTSGTGELAQHPYRSPSVFNFYRPGYVAVGTETGDAGLTMPELQIVNANSIPGFANFMTFFIFEYAQYAVDNEFVDAVDAQASFRPDYNAEIALADDPAALVDRLDRILTYGAMTSETRTVIIDTISNIPLSFDFDPDYDGALQRVYIAVLMTMTSPDFLVQR